MGHPGSRKAKLRISVNAKVIGQKNSVEYKAGESCQVQRNPNDPGTFIVWFSKTHIAHVVAEQLPETIQYVDGKPEGWQ